MDFIVIGTGHNLQKTTAGTGGLGSLLQTVWDEHSVVMIAEEVDTRDENICTFGRLLAGESGWLSIDMTLPQQEAAGIKKILDEVPFYDSDGKLTNIYLKSAQAVRELFWLDRIEQKCKERCLTEGVVVVTCGANHVRFLTEKMSARGHRVLKRLFHPANILDQWPPLDVRNGS